MKSTPPLRPFELVSADGQDYVIYREFGVGSVALELGRL